MPLYSPAPAARRSRPRWSASTEAPVSRRDPAGDPVPPNTPSAGRRTARSPAGRFSFVPVRRMACRCRAVGVAGRANILSCALSRVRLPPDSASQDADGRVEGRSWPRRATGRSPRRPSPGLPITATTSTVRFGGAGPLGAGAGGRLHRRDPRHRAGRQRRGDPRGRPGAHHRLPRHRGRERLAHHPGRPLGAGPRARLRRRHRLRPRPGAGRSRRPGPAARPFGRAEDRRPGRGGRGGRTPALRRRRGRRPAGIRRLLGVRARRGAVHRARAPALGRHRADRPGGRPARHRLAAVAAGRRAAARGRSTWWCRSTCCRRSSTTSPRAGAPTVRPAPGSASTPPRARRASW